MDWFKFERSEPVRDRIVRCCTAALAAGPMGEKERGEFYAKFINCGMSPAGFVAKMPVKSIASWRTSCALFVRAVQFWCGKATKPAVNGSGMFTYIGDVSYSHPAWVRFTGDNLPKPGDIFYIASSAGSNDGHTGIFLADQGEGVWSTAEGGGGDGTRCAIGKRTISNVVKFDRFNRKLLGWFDCEKLGIPFQEKAVELPANEPKEDVPPFSEVVDPHETSNVVPIKPEPIASTTKDRGPLFAVILVAVGIAIALFERMC